MTTDHSSKLPGGSMASERPTFNGKQLVSQLGKGDVARYAILTVLWDYSSDAIADFFAAIGPGARGLSPAGNLARRRGGGCVPHLRKRPGRPVRFSPRAMPCGNGCERLRRDGA